MNVNNKSSKIKEKYYNNAVAWEVYMNYTDHLNGFFALIYYGA
jgi:hypothetical protein